MTAAENFRIEPNQAVLAVLEPGAQLAWVQTLGTWIEADLEGWVWAQSLQVTDREGYDLVVSASEGENLRTRPQGEVVGRLAEGALLEELERIPGWILVRRRGFVWAASARVEDQPASRVDVPSVSGAPASTRRAASEAAGPASGDSPPAAAQTPPAGGGFAIRPGTVVRTAPDGDTLLRVTDPARVSVVGAEGGWARVLVEGWVRVPEGASVDAPPPRSGGGGLDIAAVAADPIGSVGATVTWDLQFISLERAGELRREFEPGEPYLLMRPAGGGTGRFVYVAIPEASVAAAENYVPLERFTVRGRVRSGASAVSGGAVIELVEMTRRR